MGFFQDLKQDLSQAVNDLGPAEDEESLELDNIDDTLTSSDDLFGDSEGGDIADLEAMLEQEVEALSNKSSDSLDDLFNSIEEPAPVKDIDSLLGDLDEDFEAMLENPTNDIDLNDNEQGSEKELFIDESSDNIPVLDEADDLLSKEMDSLDNLFADTPVMVETPDLFPDTISDLNLEDTIDLPKDNESTDGVDPLDNLFADAPVMVETPDLFTEEPAVAETADIFAEEPVVEESVAETADIFAEEPVVEEPVAETADLFSEEPVVEEPAVAETADLFAEESVVEEPAVAETADIFAEEPVVEEPAVAETADLFAEEPVVEEPAVAETADIFAEESVVEEPVAETVDLAEEINTAQANTGVSVEEVEMAQAEEVVTNSIENATAPVTSTAVITEGMTITGDISSTGNMDLSGCVNGNIDIQGKLNVTGNINGNSSAAEVYVEAAQISGELKSKGSVKIGQNSVIIGNIFATSAVIAGAVKGDIDVHGPVILDSTAIVMGNIKSKSVQINNGAVIEGMCSQCYGEVNPTSFFNDVKKNRK